MVKNKALKKIALLFRWIENRFAFMASWFERREYLDDTKSKFVDLAPTDDADEEGIYSEAVFFALSKSEVFNIALTGPYGSGKSSIIQTFLKKHPLPTLQISLAAFVPEAEHDPESDTKPEEVSRQEIERSILQQMLYGADANKLPLSRFKRIQTPGFFSFLKSLYILAGALAFWFVFQQREGIIESLINGALFFPHTPADWFDLVSVVLTVAFLWSAVHYFYIASFGLSLKSLSLKDVEIKPASDDHTSILNRHLDEIIYFFQSTKYELVIIEDLDRFNNPDVFVTLREINRLINQNAGVKRRVRFLYALRDDMFVNTERTKFFEFIIPVIPIINTSNSIDMMLKQGERLEIDERLDKQFLREVSRYLNDLRLIQNIFNEYAVYVANLEINGENVLNVNKLLAVLIYKNVYPRDFELLHRNEGKLAKVLELKSELVKSGEAKYRDEIIEIERQLEVAERQVPSDLKELRQIYAMALIEKLAINDSNISFSLDRESWVDLTQLVNHDEFDQLITASDIFYRRAGQRVQRASVSNLQGEVKFLKPYEQRKAKIESKAIDNKKKSLQRTNELRNKIKTLRTTKLNELLHLNSEAVQEHFESFGKDWELARFLILEGYLDDTYYQYTSLFHAGRLSPNDNKFLVQIRAYATPEPSFPIDNPKEVIGEMRPEDFGQSYVLNIRIVDTLLSDQALYSSKQKKLFELISAEFEDCEEFFDAYYVNGENVKGFLYELIRTWKGFIPNAIASSKNTIHITKLVTNLPMKTLGKLANDLNELPEFVAENLSEILDNAPELEAERLICLGFEVKDLMSIKEHPEIVRAMFEEGHFELTIANLEYIYQEILGKNDLRAFRESNFTTLRSVNNPALIKRIDKEFDTYLSNVLLLLSENLDEDAAAILAIVNHEELEQEQLREFIERQTNKLLSFDDVPDKLYSMLLELNAVEPTWKNCLAFMDREEFHKEELISYLDREDVRAEILKQPLPSDSDSLSLRLLLINADSMSDEAYSEYTHALPTLFKSFPKELALSKQRILIDEKKIAFSKENLDYLNESKELQVLFVSKNIDKYLLEPDSFELDDDFRESLLKTEISDTAKLELIELMDLETLEGFPNRAVLIGSIIKRTNAELSELNGTIAQALVTHSEPVATQVFLLNKYHGLMTNDEIRHVLTCLPKPYSEINIGRHTPKLKDTAENKILVKWLDERHIISSFKVGGLFDGYIRINLYRK